MINIFNHSKLLSTCALFLLVQNHLIVSHLSISCSDYIKFDFDQLEIVKNCFYNFIVISMVLFGDKNSHNLHKKFE